MSSIDAVSIAHQKARRLIVRECVDNLLGGPLCVGIGSDIEMQDFSSIVPQHDENVEDSKRNGRHGEEIVGDNVWSVVVEEGFPSL